MRLFVPTNWDKGLLEKLSDMPVDTLYGQLARDITGGGRPSFLLPKVSKEDIKEYIQEVHSHGMKFNYLVNPQCLGNMEFTKEFHNKILKHLEWIVNIDADYVTVTIPMLLQIIKKQFPDLKVIVSVFAHVDTVRRAESWEMLGADIISFPECVNRDFKLLKEISKSVKCDLQLITNLTCVYGCPFWIYHTNMVGHASRLDDPSQGFYIDYCLLNCSRLKVEDPTELIKSRWIRPEDLKMYEDLGIDNFKITERFSSTETLIRTVKAYSSRRYDGNLIDILNLRSKKGAQLPANVEYLIRPEFANVKLLADMEEVLYSAEGSWYIDNRDLDGFLEFFKHKNCDSSSCDECGYCKEIAEKVVKVDPKKRDFAISRLNKMIDDLTSSRIFQ